MGDGTVGVLQAGSPDRLIDNEVLSVGGQTVYRQRVSIGNSLVPVSFDYASLAYTGDDLTSVTYKQGGAAGSTVATLTLAYSSGKLTSVTRT